MAGKVRGKRLHGGSSPLRASKYNNHPHVEEANKRKRQEKWARNRRRWAEDEAYQKQKAERNARLKRNV